MTDELHSHHDHDRSDPIERTLQVGELIKMLGGWVIGAIALVISIVFWIQSQGNDKYYPKLSGENLEKQLTKLEQHMEGIENQNMEMIRILGRIEGGQDKQ